MSRKIVRQNSTCRPNRDGLFETFGDGLLRLLGTVFFSLTYLIKDQIKYFLLCETKKDRPQKSQKTVPKSLKKTVPIGPTLVFYFFLLKIHPLSHLIGNFILTLCPAFPGLTWSTSSSVSASHIFSILKLTVSI